MVMICPYCDTEINEKQLEQEDGCCPECGAIITASTVINEEDEDEYDEDDEFNDGDEEDQDEFNDGDDTEDQYGDDSDAYGNDDR